MGSVGTDYWVKPLSRSRAATSHCPAATQLPSPLRLLDGLLQVSQVLSRWKTMGSSYKCWAQEQLSCPTLLSSFSSVLAPPSGGFLWTGRKLSVQDLTLMWPESSHLSMGLPNNLVFHPGVVSCVRHTELCAWNEEYVSCCKCKCIIVI